MIVAGFHPAYKIFNQNRITDYRQLMTRHSASAALSESKSLKLKFTSGHSIISYDFQPHAVLIAL